MAVNKTAAKPKSSANLKQVQLCHIGVMSTAKLMAVLCAAFGLIEGLMIFLFSLLGFSAYGIIVGVVAIVAIPIVAAIMGFIMGAIEAFIYNLVAEHIGGLRLKVEID